MKDFYPGEKYKTIEGIKDVFNYFGKKQSLSNIQMLYIIQRCFALGWTDHKPVNIDLLMDTLLDKI